LAVKFGRFFELNLSVTAKFHTISSHSRTKSFAPHEHRSYLLSTQISKYLRQQQSSADFMIPFVLSSMHPLMSVFNFLKPLRLLLRLNGRYFGRLLCGLGLRTLQKFGRKFFQNILEGFLVNKRLKVHSKPIVPKRGCMER
jgi:hypothetical protein